MDITQNLDIGWQCYSTASVLVRFHDDLLTRFPFVVQRNYRVAPDLDVAALVPDTLTIEAQKLLLKGSHPALEDFIDHPLESIPNPATKADVYARSDQGSLYLDKGKEDLTVWAASTSIEAAELLLSSLDVPQPPVPPTDSISIQLWWMGQEGAQSRSKQITAASWDTASINYPPEVRIQLTSLLHTPTPTIDQGKLILLHGVPGSGKTSFIRTLGQQWKDWCQIHYIADPEKLFGIPSYLLEVAGEEDDKWQLIIAEDSDEFLKPDARHEAGASLGRLLNFSDGILGQGSKTLILITTNEPLNKLHPAITRPGRCLASIHFEAFSQSEARQWFEDQQLIPPPTLPQKNTLAELVEMKDHAPRIVTKISSGVGFGA